MTVTLTGRAFNGFIHAFITNCFVQLCCLLIVNLVLLVVLLNQTRNFKSKFNLVMSSLILITKVFTGAVLIYEYKQSFSISAQTPLESSFKELAAVVLMCVCCFLMGLSYLFNEIGSFVKTLYEYCKACCSSSKKMVSVLDDSIKKVEIKKSIFAPQNRITAIGMECIKKPKRTVQWK